MQGKPKVKSRFSKPAAALATDVKPQIRFAGVSTGPPSPQYLGLYSQLDKQPGTRTQRMPTFHTRIEAMHIGLQALKRG